nr:MAG TPA: hypothetical protein [Crassvirales sp.]
MNKSFNFFLASFSVGASCKAYVNVSLAVNSN